MKRLFGFLILRIAYHAQVILPFPLPGPGRVDYDQLKARPHPDGCAVSNSSFSYNELLPIQSGSLQPDVRKTEDSQQQLFSIRRTPWQPAPPWWPSRL